MQVLNKNGRKISSRFYTKEELDIAISKKDFSDKKWVIHDGINAIGGKFGELTIVDNIKDSSNNHTNYYLCACSCGEHFTSRWENLRNGTRDNCGCITSKRVSEKLKKGDKVAAFNHLYSRYKFNAKNKGMGFELSKELFRELTSSNCEYCGNIPSNIMLPQTKNTGSYTYNGIDRIDNSKGYLIDNCRPCCTTCNFMKTNSSEEFFIEHIKKIYLNYCNEK